MSLIVGLTGGIACGKSVISREFSSLQVPVVDTDLLAREAVAKGSPVLNELVDAFGQEILDRDGELNRPMMRRTVFGRADRLQRLNAIMHPAILSQAEDCFERLRQHAYILFVVPLLFELGWQSRVDRILVADAQEEIQLERLQKRDGIDEKLAHSMLKAQFSRQKRRELAQDLIETDKHSLEEIRKIVLELHVKYCKLAGKTA